MKKKIKRVYHDYRNWECYKNNMYIERKMEERDFFVAKALELLRDTDKLKIQMLRSVDEWFYSTEQYMTVTGSNRQAWLGQAACNICYGVTETETRMAWRELTEEERDKANSVADEVISYWEGGYFNENRIG